MAPKTNAEIPGTNAEINGMDSNVDFGFEQRCFRPLAGTDMLDLYLKSVTSVMLH